VKILYVTLNNYEEFINYVKKSFYSILIKRPMYRASLKKRINVEVPLDRL